jgi:hypothetical protein
MKPGSPPRVSRSQLPYNATTARHSTKRCKELTQTRINAGADLSEWLIFNVRLVNSTSAKKDFYPVDRGPSVWVLPANYFGLIQQAIYSAGTISAGFWMYDGGSAFFAFLSVFINRVIFSAILHTCVRERVSVIACPHVCVCPAEIYAYRGGVYARQLLGQERTGRHAVAVIGYGLDNGTQYWIYANSWGTVLPNCNHHIPCCVRTSRSTLLTQN